MTTPLTGKALDAALATLPGWRRAEDRSAISRSFRFANFAHAFSWMTCVALKAEQMNHHPEWTNIYNRVDVTLTTHDAGGITEKDIDLARYMNDSLG